MIAPVIDYASPRLVGIEIEIDSGDMKLRLPTVLPGGWVKHHDGSLRNGTEMVMEPPCTLDTARTVIRGFDTKFNESRTNTCKRGGMHVHVQANENAYTIDKMANLARLYTHFKSVINSLIGESRHDNSYCGYFDRGVDAYTLQEMFSLNSPAHGRAAAKQSRSYKVVNFAMMRCSNAFHRTIEFRQGSTAKRYDSIYGWAVLMVALTDIALWHDVGNSGRGTFSDFITLLERHQQRRLDDGHACDNLAEWVKWRHEYMNQEPTAAHVEQAIACMGVSPRGMYHISRELDVSLPLAKRILERAAREGAVTAVADGKTYRAKYEAWAESDFSSLISEATRREAEEPAFTEPPEQQSPNPGSVNATPPLETEADAPPPRLRRLRTLIQQSQQDSLDPGHWNTGDMTALVRHAATGIDGVVVTTSPAGGDYDTEFVNAAVGEDTVSLQGFNSDKPVTVKSDYDISFVVLRTIGEGSDDRGGLQSNNPETIEVFCAIQAKLAAARFVVERTHEAYF